MRQSQGPEVTTNGTIDQRARAGGRRAYLTAHAQRDPIGIVVTFDDGREQTYYNKDRESNELTTERAGE